jgi:hypothetical protein
MADIISRTAAADDIFNDVRKTLTNANARGGRWQEYATERLAKMLTLIDLIEARNAEARTALAPLAAAVDAQDASADRFIGRIADEVWNAAGRPASDPNLAIIFPGGIGFYTDGPDIEQPERMDLMAELLETIPVPKVDQALLAAAAQQTRAQSASYRTVLDAVKVPRARARLLERVRTALARSAQTELAHLKRLYKASGFSDAEIHAVIPHRTRNRRGAEPAEPTPPAPTLPAPAPAAPTPTPPA